MKVEFSNLFVNRLWLRRREADVYCVLERVGKLDVMFVYLSYEPIVLLNAEKFNL